MLEPDPSFRPLVDRDGYLRHEDLGLIGDGTTAALVGRDGTMPWLCVPRFDSEPVFCALLDRTRGGQRVSVFATTPHKHTQILSKASDTMAAAIEDVIHDSP